MNSADPFDLLIEFLSAKQTGSWAEFKVATLAVASGVEARPPPWLPSVVAGHLTALAHLEIAFDGDLGWSVCPPALVTSTALGQQRVFLCGRRTDRLLEQLRTLARQPRVDLSQASQRFAPARIGIEVAADSGLQDLAATLQVPLVANAADRLLRVLPTLGSLAAAAPVVAAPTGYETFRFDPETLSWLPVARIQGDGSYRVDYYRPEFRVVQKGVPRRVQQAVALYHALAMAGRDVLAYSSASQTLAVPARLRLPVLFARALALCSGSVPDYCSDDGCLRFAAILPAFAATAAQKLRSLQE